MSKLKSGNSLLRSGWRVSLKYGKAGNTGGGNGERGGLYSADIFGQGGVFRCGKGGVFRCGCPHFLVQKTLDFYEGVGLN